MPCANVQFNAKTVIELSFAAMAKDKEDQLFGKYFPKVMPLVAAVNNGAATALNRPHE